MLVTCEEGFIKKAELETFSCALFAIEMTAVAVNKTHQYGPRVQAGPIAADIIIL
jgi:hypothetical protein